MTAALIVANLLLGLSMVALADLAAQAALVPVAQVDRHHDLPADVAAPRVARAAPASAAGADAARGSGARPRVSHALLYVLLFVIPISGWLYSSATGVQVVYLGLVPLPDLVPQGQGARRCAAASCTSSLNALLFAVVCVHVAAALKHHFVDRDAVLARMLPFVKANEALRS